MNRDDILRMAREAGFELDCCSLEWHGRIERFAAIVAVHSLVEPCCQQFDKCQKVCMPRAAAAERKRIADIIRSDKYGIGNMCSQWTSDDVADDILEGRV